MTGLVARSICPAIFLIVLAACVANWYPNGYLADSAPHYLPHGSNCSIVLITLTGTVGTFFACYLIWRRAPAGKFAINEWTRLLHIGGTTLVFITLFTPPGMELRDKDPQSICYTEAIQKVFKAESEGAGNEIARRLDHIDQWFNYKFALVGALIAAFLIPLKGRKSDIREIEDLLKSALGCMVLSFACIVAFAVDIHIRNDVMAIYQLGSWLHHYAEPCLSGVPFQTTECCSGKSSLGKIKLACILTLCTALHFNRTFIL